MTKKVHEVHVIHLKGEGYVGYLDSKEVTRGKDLSKVLAKLTKYTKGQGL